jgi:hypothetical protein
MMTMSGVQVTVFNETAVVCLVIKSLSFPEGLKKNHEQAQSGQP